MNLISILINNWVWLQKRNTNKIATIENLKIEFIRDINIRTNRSLNEYRTLKSRENSREFMTSKTG